MKGPKICAECGEPIEENEETEGEDGEKGYVELEDGTILCECCYEEMYGTCEMCGAIVPRDELEFWGDCRICAACMEAECPSVDEEKNEDETTPAYEAMRARYIGRKSTANRGRILDLTFEIEDSAITYSMTAEFDDDGVLVDVSRLSAEITLSEWERGSSTRAYRICPEDYGWIADDMFESVEFDGE